MQWSNADPGSAPALAEDAEVVANLWYVMDYQGFIYSLRVMTYVAAGTDGEKLYFLDSRAHLDYLVARPFAVPERYCTTFASPSEEITYAVIHHDAAKSMGGVEKLFFDALDQMQADFPAQTTLDIPKSPLIKVTALYGTRDGEVIPVDALSPEQKVELGTGAPFRI